MQPGADPLTTALLAYGPPGIIIAALLAALGKVFNLYVASQEKRIEEGQKSVTAMERGTDALDRLTAVVNERRNQG